MRLMGPVRLTGWLIGCIAITLVALPASALEATGDLVEAECPVDTSWTYSTIDCYTLTVPANHSRPGGPEIELAVMILRSVSDDPLPDPVIYLEGGPGGAPIPYFDLWVDSPLLAERDLILIDPRGTGYSQPFLECPELYAIPLEGTTEDSIDALAACRARLEAQGIDLSAYNTVQNALDVAALRSALSVERWNLYGISYGTRVALAVMRLDPEGVRSSTLDSVLPPEIDLIGEWAGTADEAIGGLIEACANDAGCAARYPDLSEQIDAIDRRLDDEQPTIDVPWLDGSDMFYPMTVVADDFDYALGSALYDPTLIPIIPWVIERVAHGDDTALGSLLALANYQGPVEASADGVYYSVVCHDEFPFASEAALAGDREASAWSLSFSDACPVWENGQADPVENQAVTSDIPTLLVAGAIDPATPANWAIVAAESLSNSTTAIVQAGGHGVTTGGCGLELVTEFIDNPEVAPDTSCADDQPDFSLRPVPVPGIGFLNGTSNELGAALLALAAWMLVGLTGVAMWKWSIGGGLHHWLWLLSLSMMGGFMILAALWVLIVVVASPSSAPLFAQPAIAWIIFLIPGLGLLTTAVASVMTLVSIVGGRTRPWAIIPYGVLGLAILLMVVAFGMAGLIPFA